MLAYVKGGGDTVYCEVCELPHRNGALRCEACEHELGTPPNWDAMRARLPDLRTKVLLGLVVLSGIMAGNFVAWGGGGYIIALGPIGWTVWYGYQYRLISARLQAAERRSSPQR
jgi:hypothetical protein